MSTSTPTHAYRSIWTDLHRTSFTQDWVNAGGIRTRYVNAGRQDAPAVIMLHGTGGSWEGFSANLGALSERYNCFALDMIGCGFSDKPAFNYEIAEYVAHLRHFMRALNIERASFIGVSLGSWIAAAFALAHAQATDKLILISAAGLVARSEIGNRVKKQRQSASEQPTWQSVSAIFQNLIRDEENRIDDLVAVRLAAYSQAGSSGAMQRILAVLEPETWERNLITRSAWQSILAPTLLIASVDCADTYLEDARTLATLLPNARIAEMGNVAHWPQFEDPATFNSLALDFLRRGLAK